MAGGFSFCGTDIANIGLEYVPELEDTYVYKTAKSRIHEETYDGHNGGYYYGTSREPKEFILRCYFDQRDIDRGLMAKIYALFREGRSGRLIFDRRPWCYYYATVTELDTTGLTTHFSGTIRVVMKAYYPYARADIMSITRQSEDYARMMENTAFFEKEEMVPPVMFCQDGPIIKAHPESYSLLLANPGSENAQVGIEIAGDVGRGVSIINETTGQTCKFVSIKEDEFDGEFNYVYLDGINGKSIAVKDGYSSVSFLYHDEGFIELAPAFPCRRELHITVKDGIPYSVNKLYDRFKQDREEVEKEYIGKHLWCGNKWHEITGLVNEHQISLADASDYSDGRTMICQLNKIRIEPMSEMRLTRLKFVYKPTFA